MSAFAAELRRQLEAIRGDGLYRELRRVDSPQSSRVRLGGRDLVNFSSNDYLGLANHPEVKEAAARAARDAGAGAGASRLVCGSLAVHHELDEALAAFKGAEAALSFSSGYAAALGTITALVGRGDVVVLDHLAHACLVDAARLSGARLRVFAHNDLDELADILRWASRRHATSIPPNQPRPRTLVVTESVFSMDGDQAPLRKLVELKDRHGAWLLLDEAHAVGLFGPNRRGLAEAAGVTDRIEVQMGTLGKALGSAGGYVCGASELIAVLVNRARSFIFSTAPVPAAAAAAQAALGVIASPVGAVLTARLWERVASTRAVIEGAGWRLGTDTSAILPLVIGGEAAAVEASNGLRERGVLVPAIRFPAVARGAARLRLTVSAAHEANEIETLAGALNALPRELRRPPTRLPP